LVGRKHDKLQHQHRKRDPRFFLLEIQQRFEATSDDDWYSGGEVCRIVLEYYFALRSLLRDKPKLRRLLTRCRHCGIFFIAHPRNVGREDLGCPFGCAGLHRRRGSDERSTAYNRSPMGKLKRAKHEEERRLSRERSAPEVVESPEARSVEVLKVSLDMVGPSMDAISPDLRDDPPRPLPDVISLAPDPMAVCPEASGPGTDMSSREEGVDPSPRDSASRGDSPPFEPQERFDPGIVTYIRFVISLIEGRRVQREEILEMLARTKRQRSFARERRVDYVLRRLSEEPEKPP
jgi:hypothetical protein